MVIRRARLEDKDDVIKLFRELDDYHRINLPHIYRKISEEYRTQQYFSRMESDTSIFLVAEEDNKVIGFVDALIETVKDDPRLLDNNNLLIDNLIVTEAYKRKGIARKLFEYIENEAHIRDLDYIKLGVMEFNDAQKFYENMGYTTISRGMRKDLK